MIVRLPKGWKVVENKDRVEFRRFDTDGADITETVKGKAEADKVITKVLEVMS